MDDRICRHLVEKALSMACATRSPEPGLLRHSDRSSQYASGNDQKLLKANGIVCSMSRTGNCRDNAAMESFLATPETELAYHRNYETRAEAQSDIVEYIEVF